MGKPDPIECALDRLSELRHEAPSPKVVEELRAALRNRSNLVVTKAAKVARELRTTELLPEMLAAFDRLMANAPKLDKRCAAVTELATTLYELDYVEPEPYLKGMKHVQMEGSYGPPVDEAAKLRAVSAQVVADAISVCIAGAGAAAGGSRAGRPRRSGASTGS